MTYRRLPASKCPAKRWTRSSQLWRRRVELTSKALCRSPQKVSTGRRFTAVRERRGWRLRRDLYCQNDAAAVVGITGFGGFGGTDRAGPGGFSGGGVSRVCSRAAGLFAGFGGAGLRGAQSGECEVDVGGGGFGRAHHSP